MYYYGGYQGYGCGNPYGGYGAGNNTGSGGAIILVLFILLVIILGARAWN
ncbi:MAG: sporulation protein YjcZ [Bacilli bacterium]|nr:sporulation protein YjcZ [Bacilli bacterium]